MLKTIKLKYDTKLYGSIYCLLQRYKTKVFLKFFFLFWLLQFLILKFPTWIFRFLGLLIKNMTTIIYLYSNAFF